MAGETFEQWWAQHCYEWEPKDRQDALSDVRIGWHACAESQRAEVERAVTAERMRILGLLRLYLNTYEVNAGAWSDLISAIHVAAVRGEGEGA